MRTLSLADAKAHLSAVVDQAEAGEETVITRRGRPVARIVPARRQPAGRAAALVKDLEAFVMRQPLQKEPATALVRRMRDNDERY